MRFEFTEGSSRKFWEATLEATSLLVKWGRLGTTGQQKTHAFATPSEARAELEALVAEKTKKGYRRVDAPVQPPRDANLESALPKLTRLELWFGSTDYGADVKVKHLSRLLDGAVFPRVTDLGLRNAEFTNELATALPGSGIARRLVRLDLSMGVLDGGGAKSLVAGAKSFPKLKTLVVSQSHLAPGDIKALKQGFPGVDLEAKDQKHTPGEPHHRYVTVGE